MTGWTILKILSGFYLLFGILWKPIYHLAQKSIIKIIDLYVTYQKFINPINKGIYYTSWTYDLSSSAVNIIEQEFGKFFETCRSEHKPATFIVPKSDYSNKDRIMMAYTHNNHEYYVIYHLKGLEEINIPMYTETEIKENKGTSGVVKAFCRDPISNKVTNTVTDVLRKLAGPMGNFYADLDLKISPRDIDEMLWGNTGLPIIGSNNILAITDRSFKTHKFKYDDKVRVHAIRLPELNKVFHPKTE